MVNYPEINEKYLKKFSKSDMNLKQINVCMFLIKNLRDCILKIVNKNKRINDKLSQILNWMNYWVRK